MKKSLLAKCPVMTNDNVYNAIKSALFNYYYLMRADLKKRWKSLPKKDRREAVAALRYLENVFNNPAAYFSRAATQDVWNKRAVEYAKSKGIGVVDSFYIVHGPREQFIENVKNACYLPELYQDLYKFAGVIQNWEYDRTSVRPCVRDNSQKFADKIIETSRTTQKIVDVMDANPLVRPLKQFVNCFQR